MEQRNNGVAPGWYESVFSVAEECRTRGLVLYGAGFWGDLTAKVLALFGVAPCLACDDDPAKQGALFANCTVTTLAAALRREPRAVYIAAAESQGPQCARAKMNRKLREAGVWSDASGFNVLRYTYLLECGLTPFDEPLEAGFSSLDFQKLIVLNHMSESGCIYFDNLMDGHSQILNVPCFGQYVDLPLLWEKRLRYLRGKALAAEITCQFMAFLSSSLEESIFPELFRLGSDYCLNAQGECEQRVYIDPGVFVRALMREIALLEPAAPLTLGRLLKIVFAAYNNATGRKPQAGASYYLFYEMHQSDQHPEKLTRFHFEQDFERVEYLYIVRNPIQQTFAWIRRVVLQGEKGNRIFFSTPPEVIKRLRSATGAMLVRKATGVSPVHVVRFEDLKFDARKTMDALCAYLDIPYESCLEETTVNGYRVYFPVVLPDGRKQWITGNDPHAAQRKDFSEVLTPFDIFRLELASWQFKKAYGYAVDAPSSARFSPETIRELFAFDFKMYTHFAKYSDEVENIKQFATALLVSAALSEKKNTYYPLIHADDREGASV